MSYTLGGTAQAVDAALTIADTSSATLSGATVSISGGLQSGDTLTFTTQNGITGSYANGVLTLTGSASLSNYQTALDSVTFSTTSTNAAARTVSWQASDGVNSSNTVTSTIDIASTPPVLAGAGNTVSYTLGGTAQTVDAALTVADTSSTTLAGATVSISGGLQSGDALTFATQNGITGSYANGVLTLTGSASLANYQTALDSVTFSTTSTNQAARTVSWQASDGVNSSNTVTSTIDIASTPPVLAGAGNTVNYTLGGTAQTVDAALTVADTSSTTLAGATVSISGGLQSGDALNFTNQNGITGSYASGVLSLSGSASLATYQTALDSVTFSTTSTNSAARTVSWQASDGVNSSNTVTSTVDIASTPPVLAGAGNTVNYTLGGTAQAVDAGLTVADTSSPTLAGATVSISGGLQSGDALNFTTQNGITGGYANGVLTLTGSASLANYQTALDSVTFSTTSTNAAARTVTWKASDGVNSSNTVTSTVDIASTPPVLAGAGNTVNYTLGGTAQAVDAGLTVADTSSATLSGATVSISGGLQSGDALNFTTQNGITGSYANGVLTLSGSASLANYQTALDSVTFSTTSTNSAARTVSWKASDGLNSSNTVTSTVDIASTPPVLAGAGNTVSYTLGGTAQAVDAALTVSDTSSATLSGATVSIGGFQSGDQLNFTNQNGITGSYSNGVLTLSGAASLANYQTALELGDVLHHQHQHGRPHGELAGERSLRKPLQCRDEHGECGDTERNRLDVCGQRQLEHGIGLESGHRARGGKPGEYQRCRDLHRHKLPEQLRGKP